MEFTEAPIKRRGDGLKLFQRRFGLETAVMHWHRATWGGVPGMQRYHTEGCGQWTREGGLGLGWVS